MADFASDLVNQIISAPPGSYCHGCGNAFKGQDWVMDLENGFICQSCDYFLGGGAETREGNA